MLACIAKQRDAHSLCFLRHSSLTRPSPSAHSVATAATPESRAPAAFTLFFPPHQRQRRNCQPLQVNGEKNREQSILSVSLSPLQSAPHRPRSVTDNHTHSLSASVHSRCKSVVFFGLYTDLRRPSPLLTHHQSASVTHTHTLSLSLTRCGPLLPLQSQFKRAGSRCIVRVAAAGMAPRPLVVVALLLLSAVAVSHAQLYNDPVDVEYRELNCQGGVLQVESARNERRDSSRENTAP